MKFIEKLAEEKVQNYINAHLDKDIHKLSLSKNPFEILDFKAIVNQIVAKNKAKEKLPTWFNCSGIIYPEKISIEQTSSELTAQYKSDLISGKSLVDLTGGFGVDDYYFSKKFDDVYHCELNPILSEIVKKNWKTLQIKNIRSFCGDSIDFLKNSTIQFDWIYIDPSRRNNTKGKVFMLKDCLPNVPEQLDTYFDFSKSIMIKTAPILDIQAGLKELNHVKEIHCVAVQNEMKELLWILEKNYNQTPKIIACNISNQGVQTFNFLESDSVLMPLSEPKKYLYEPNTAVMKSGGMDILAVKNNLEKLHFHSHLYTSNDKIDFLGRRFLVLKVEEFSKKAMKDLQNTNYNITFRNFPDTVESIRKKWKIREGGKNYLFFTTTSLGKQIIFCEKC